MSTGGKYAQTGADSRADCIHTSHTALAYRTNPPPLILGPIAIAAAILLPSCPALRCGQPCNAMHDLVLRYRLSAWRLTRDNLMKRIGIGILIGIMSFTAANAAGWGSVHKYVKPSGNCAGQEILASSYSSGKRTASGERFDASGNTAAARTWPIGTTLTVTNPKNGRSLTVRINDTGPWGVAYRMGARLDLAKGAAQRLGMSGSQYVCVA